MKRLLWSNWSKSAKTPFNLQNVKLIANITMGEYGLFTGWWTSQTFATKQFNGMSFYLAIGIDDNFSRHKAHIHFVSIGYFMRDEACIVAELAKILQVLVLEGLVLVLVGLVLEIFVQYFIENLLGMHQLFFSRTIWFSILNFFYM